MILGESLDLEGQESWYGDSYRTTPALDNYRRWSHFKNSNVHIHMILNNHYKIVEIDITTYRRSQEVKYNYNNMNENITERFRKSNQNRFICSICLNKKSLQDNTRGIECCKRLSKSCPICQKHSGIDEKRNDDNNERNGKDDFEKTSTDTKYINGKIMQTSQPDLSKGLTLLNEVLTVFQNKKQTDSKKESKSKTVILKDASVETDTIKSKPKLSFSKTFLYTIGEIDEGNKNGKFSIINSEPAMKSQFAIDLKHKSSSIPQMKLEELKNSLKEKTKSKDAIEEVNRMFATVRKFETRDSLDDSNRPMIRNGPRVLPVVKTNCNGSGNKIARRENQECYNCRETYHMSSGDSVHGCCHKQEGCDECCKCCHHKHCCNFSKDIECKHTVDIRE